MLVAAGEGWKIAEAVSPSLPSGFQGLAPGNMIENDNINNVRAHKKTNNNYKMSVASIPRGMTLAKANRDRRKKTMTKGATMLMLAHTDDNLQ